MDEIKYRPIGVVRSRFKEPCGVPIQSAVARGIDGTVEVFPEFVEGLKDIDGFSHIILLCGFHLTKGFSLTVKPFVDNKQHGVFATRAPSRPNPIGLSVVRLLSVKDSMLYISDVDIVDGTPILDIKPYIADFDVRNPEKMGWFDARAHKIENMKDDGRFV